jgi:N-[(2S)-2-amino-2-carboxyethyl]-L-glutamate dehydrogenase
MYRSGEHGRTMTEDKLLYLNGSDIAKVCADIDPLRCVAEALRQHAEGTARVGDEGTLRWSPAKGQSARTLNMPGLLAASAVVGTKIINANTGNPDSGLPRADGLTLLFDPSTARPSVILQAAGISALRTAAVSTLAALQLQNGSPIALALLGAGKIAETHAVLMAKYLEIDSVLIYDRIPERGQTLAERLCGMGSSCFRRVVTAEAEYAVSNANVVVAATTATSAYVPYNWITRGTAVINVSLDDIDADAYIKSDLLYVDDWQLITADTQRLLGRLAREGKVSGPGDSAPAGGRSVTGTIGQLLAGNCPGRENVEQTVLVNPFGMAIEDLALAQAVYIAAVSRGLGTPLDRLWEARHARRRQGTSPRAARPGHHRRDPALQRPPGRLSRWLELVTSRLTRGSG